MIDRVAALVREVSETAVEPRFAAVHELVVEDKSPGEVVTIADREAEALLTSGLGAVLPGVPVVGEEACGLDPSRLDGLAAERAWLVDPIDGTANFVAGSPDWAVMVALVAAGDTVASWIWQPITGRMYTAERGSGASCNGAVLRIPLRPRPREEARLRGAVLTRFLSPAHAAAVARNSARFGEVTRGRMCSGVEYPALIEGEEDFVLFWRTLPWDHAPGALLVQEAGGQALRPDGRPYRPTIDGEGLIVAADRPTWELARRLLD